MLSVTVRGGADVSGKLKSVSGVSSVETTADGAVAAGEIRYLVTAASDGDIRGAVAETVVRSGASLLEMKRESLSLEEVFLKVTTVEKHEGAVTV